MEYYTFMRGFNELSLPGPLAQMEVSLIADLGVVSLIPSRSHTFVEIDHEIFFYGYSCVSYVNNCLVKLAQKKAWVG